MIEIQPVDVAANLHAAQPKIAHTALQFAHRQVRGLHRQRAEADEAFRMFANHSGEVIVQQSGQVVTVFRLGPVGKHDRHGRQHLNGDAVAVAVFEAAARLPAVVFNVAEVFAVDHHAAQPGPVCSSWTKPP